MKRTDAVKLVLVCFLIAGMTLSLPACTSFKPPPGETEAAEYLGVKLTPIAKQNNNALKGTQYIDKNTYRLTVMGRWALHCP